VWEEIKSKAKLSTVSYSANSLQEVAQI
jgi:hypothetical protein